jgi:hypothetical protein
MSRDMRQRFGRWLYSRRRVAVHEAGHVVVARALDVPVGRAWIWPAYRDPANLPSGAVLWGGWSVAKTFSIEQSRFVAVAGAVAESCWFRDTPRHCNVEYTDTWRELMSDSDWRSAGCEPDSPDAACLDAAARADIALRRGGFLWRALVREARAIIIASRTATPDDAPAIR